MTFTKVTCDYQIGQVRILTHAPRQICEVGDEVLSEREVLSKTNSMAWKFERFDPSDQPQLKSRRNADSVPATFPSVILSDRTIRAEIAAGRIGIEPFDPEMVQPSSVDLRLDHRFLVFRSHTRAVIDVKQDLTDLTEPVDVAADGAFILHPGEFVLGSTAERVALPADLVGRIEGKSSLGRLGLLIHTTAGFVDAGFEGFLTLELSNVATLPITLYPGMKIGQISFLRMDGPAEFPYGSGGLGSKYRGQEGPTASRYWENFDK